MVPARLSTGTQSALRRSVVNVNSSAPAVARLTATPRFAAPSLYAAAPRTTPFTSAAPVHRFLHTTHPRSLRDDSGKAPTDWAGKGPISYDELKPITEAPTGDVTIIDVREPSETAQGMIPSAVNVPLSEWPVAFKSSSGGNFEQKYALPRPEYGQKMIVYCRTGKRSQQALEELKKEGWANVRNFVGSWTEWSKQEKARGKEDD